MKKRVFNVVGLSVILAVLIMVGCKKEELIRNSGTIQGVVYDGNTNAPIDGVTVKVAVNGVVIDTLSNLDGYSIADLPSGEYYLTFSKTGYASTVVGENIPEYQAGEESTMMGRSKGKNKDDNIFFVTRTLNPVMYTLNGAITGTVYKSVNSKNFPAVGVTVQVMYQDPAEVDGVYEDGYVFQGLTPNSYTAITDADGKFKLENLPATSGTFTVLSHNDGTTDFGSASRGIKLAPGLSVTTGDVVVYRANDGNLQIVDGNILKLDAGTEKLDVNANITLTFNKALTSKDVKLYSNVDNRYIPVTLTGKSLTTVTVDPQETLDVFGGYQLEVYAVSKEGDVLNQFYNFSAQKGIDYVSSNLEIADGQFTENFEVNSDITFTFNMPVNQSITLAQGNVELVNTDENSVVLIDVTYSGNQVIINPAEALESGTNYKINLGVYSSLTNDGYFSNFNFETAPNTVALPGSIIDFALSGYDADYTFDHNSTSFDVEFVKATDAKLYEIWAKDSHNNSDWTRVAYYYYYDYVTTNILNYTINLSSYPEFDYYANDGVQTPLSHGTVVSFKVRAVNDAGYGPFSSVITVSDKTVPDATDFYYSDYNSFGDANNPANATSAKIYKFTVDANSGFYFNTSDGEFNYGVTDIAPEGTPNWVDPYYITFKWINEYQGEFTLTIPAGSNFSNDKIRIYGFTDASGNQNTLDESFTITLK